MHASYGIQSKWVKHGLYYSSSCRVLGDWTNLISECSVQLAKVVAAAWTSHHAHSDVKRHTLPRSKKAALLFCITNAITDKSVYNCELHSLLRKLHYEICTFFKVAKVYFVSPCIHVCRRSIACLPFYLVGPYLYNVCRNNSYLFTVEIYTSSVIKLRSWEYLWAALSLFERSLQGDHSWLLCDFRECVCSLLSMVLYWPTLVGCASVRAWHGWVLTERHTSLTYLSSRARTNVGHQ